MTKSKHKKEKRGKTEPEKPHGNNANSGTDRVNEQRLCNSCYQMIDVQAKVCQHCNRGQGFWGKHIGSISPGVSIAAVIVSLVMMVLAIAQLLDARKKNIDASKALDTAIAAANDVKKIGAEVDVARDEIAFNLLLVRASNDDRASFFELHDLATNKDHVFQKAALQAVEQIISSLYIVPLIDKEFDWQKFNLDPTRASLDDLHNTFERMFPILKLDVLYTVWKQERFEMPEKLEFLYKIITETQSFRVLYHACKLMDEEAKLGKNFVLDYELYAKWWEENRGK